MNLRKAIGHFRGHEEFHVDFIGRRRIWFALSAALLLLSLIGLFVLQLNFGIDFEGGALLEYDNREGVSAEDVRGVLSDFGRDDAIVQLVEDGERISIRTESLGDERTEMVKALSDLTGDPTPDLTVIGPKWGEQISKKALQGLLIFLLVVTLYITFRFEWKMAIAAIVALFHDLVITAGVYALVGREVTPETVIAILTILGYSLYDTVVIFDKVKENSESATLVAREGYGGMVNLSLNHVLMRSVNTSLTVLLPVTALLFLGGETLKDFAFALLVGVGVGTYSSIFVAAPVLAVLKGREQRFAQIQARSDRRSERAPARAEASEELQPASRRASATTTLPTPAGVPRARKPKKKPRAKRKKG
ncbi:MAG TPA: protein translocase subunit SecF [Actinomycetota bacterium]